MELTKIDCNCLNGCKLLAYSCGKFNHMLMICMIHDDKKKFHQILYHNRHSTIGNHVARPFSIKLLKEIRDYAILKYTLIYIRLLYFHMDIMPKTNFQHIHYLFSIAKMNNFHEMLIALKHKQNKIM